MGSVISSIFGGGQESPAPAPQAPTPPPPAPTIDNTEVSTATADERRRRTMAEGRASTMLMQESGDEPAVARKRLLGS